jgi:hypothetical protein
MQDTFVIPVDISLKEWYKSLFVLLPRSKAFKRVFVMITVINFLGVFPLLVMGNSLNVTDILTCFAAPLSLFSFILLFMLLAGLFIKKFKPGLLRGSTYTFTHWGMEFAGFPRDVSIPWRQFRKLEETRSFILLYTRLNNHEAIHPLQKRMFAGEEEVEEFKKFVAQNLPL